MRGFCVSPENTPSALAPECGKWLWKNESRHELAGFIWAIGQEIETKPAA